MDYFIDMSKELIFIIRLSYPNKCHLCFSAELLEMQRKMQELQERLANSQAAAPKQKKTNKKSLNDNSLGDESNKKQNREKNYKPQSKHVTKDEENNIQVRDMKNDKSLKEKYKSHIEKKTIVEEIYHSQTENKLSAETSRRPSAITDGPSNKKDKIISKCHDTVETKDLYDICSNKSNSSETILQGKMRSPTGNFSNNSKAKNGKFSDKAIAVKKKEGGISK